MVICIARGEGIMSGNQKSVHKQSAQILGYLDRVEEIFHLTREKNEDPDFFLTVKPFADEVYATVQQWEKTVKEWILTEKPKNIHTQQIDSTVENINMVSVQCFYPDTREKRFKGMLQSIRYVLNDTLSK
jgi:lantibiotic modifying enzyme